MIVLAAEAGAQPTGGAANWFSALLPFLILFLVFWFILIRPQQQQQKKRREMLAGLKRGDRVITVGGIHGEITALKDDEVRLKIADKVEITVSRAGIGQVLAAK